MILFLSFFLLRKLNDYIINANAIRECNFGMGTISGKGFEQALMHKSQHLCSCILSKKVVLNFFYHFGVGLKILGLKSSFFNWTVRSGTEKFIFQLDCKVWDWKVIFQLDCQVWDCKVQDWIFLICIVHDWKVWDWKVHFPTGL